jgi:hypothetical protein
MKQITTLFLILVSCVQLIAHPWKPAHFVIVDTDGSIDDMRAITLMLASPNIRVLAITTSNGVVDAYTAAIKVKSLLNELGHQGILVGINSSGSIKSFSCIPAMDFDWGKPIVMTDTVSYDQVINQVLNFSREKISWVSLASLNSLTTYLEVNPNKASRFVNCIWSIDSVPDDNFNYRIDKASYTKLKQQVPIIQIINSVKKTNYPDSLTDFINTSYSKRFFSSFDTKPIYSHQVNDEWAALYLQDSAGFNKSPMVKNEMTINPFPDLNVMEAVIKLLNSSYSLRNQVFSVFPTDSNLYASELKGKIKKTIGRYGMDEWQACVITCELHRHLGVYALIGAKMGVRAKEYFGAGVDEMKVVSYAGSTPPISCMNDGIQVSAGASLGHGLIQLDNNTEALPEADFEYLGQKIHIRLKNEYRQKIDNDVRQLELIYGLNNSKYWEILRVSAIEIWLGWDRKDIFEIERR